MIVQLPGIQPEIAVQAIPDDERVWVPQAPLVWFRPLLLNTVTGQWCNLLRVRKSGVLSRHIHPSIVTGYVIRYRKIGANTWDETSNTATSRTYRVSGLTAATQYEFQIFSKSPSGKLSSSGSAVSTGITGSATLNGCLIGTITVTPPGVPKKSAATSADLESTPMLVMPVNGTCTNYDVVYKKVLAGASVTQQMIKGTGSYSMEFSHYDQVPGNVQQQIVKSAKLAADEDE